LTIKTDKNCFFLPKKPSKTYRNEIFLQWISINYKFFTYLSLSPE